MKRLVLLLMTWGMCFPLFAQTASFTWTGSTDSSQEVELVTVDGAPINQSTSYAGVIQVVNGSFLWLLDLPQSLGFPNNGNLECHTQLTFGAKQWGTRADGTTMDGTKAGDSYTLPGTTICPQWNGTTDISLLEFRQMVQHRSCRYYPRCTYWLVDTMENGSGVATVE